LAPLVVGHLFHLVTNGGCNRFELGFGFLGLADVTAADSICRLGSLRRTVTVLSLTGRGSGWGAPNAAVWRGRSLSMADKVLSVQ
jgi:hypothetical protein